MATNKLKSGNDLKSGNNCAHQFHENCFGTVAENEKALEIKAQLEELVKSTSKFTTRGILKTNNRRAKEGRSKARTRKMKRVTAKIDNKHLMTGPKGNSEFCFPESIEGRGETKLTVSRGASH